MATKKKTQGGKRKGAGRRPIDPNKKKIPLTIYIERQTIVNEGGENEFREMIYKLIENRAKQ